MCIALPDCWPSPRKLHLRASQEVEACVQDSIHTLYAWLIPILTAQSSYRTLEQPMLSPVRRLSATPDLSEATQHTMLEDAVKVPIPTPVPRREGLETRLGMIPYLQWAVGVSEWMAGCAVARRPASKCCPRRPCVMTRAAVVWAVPDVAEVHAAF